MVSRSRAIILCLVGGIVLTSVACGAYADGERPPDPTGASLHPTLPPSRTITSSAVTSDGAIWYAYDEFDEAGGSSPYAQRLGLYRLLDGQVSHYEIPGTIRTLRNAPSDDLYVGAGCGVLRFHEEVWETLADVDCDNSSFARPMVPFDIAIAPGGTVWVGGVCGLARFDGTAWTEYGVNARRLLVAPDDSLWAEGWDGKAGSDCCFVHVTGTVVTTYTHTATLPVSPDLLGKIHGLASR